MQTRRSRNYGQFLVLYATIIGLWMCGEAVAKVCWVGNEPDHSGKMKFVLRESDPCSCTRIRPGGVNMPAMGQHYHHGHGSTPFYFNGPVMTEDPNEIASLLHCNANDDEEHHLCVSFITSGSQYNYKFEALPKSVDGAVRFEFSARAPNDVHISLVEQNGQDSATDGMYEIVVGGWKDTASVIRRSKQGKNLTRVYEPSGWLDEHTNKEFWVSVIPATSTGKQTVSIGKGSETNAFMTFEDDATISVNYVGFGLFTGIKENFTFCGLALEGSA